MNLLRTSSSLAIFAALGMIAFTGCASFEREWKTGQRQPHVRCFLLNEPRDPFTGRWEGRWTSAKHHKSSGEAMGGRLRCVLTKLDDRRYEARFKANWLVFASGYTTVFEVERRAGGLQLQGEHRMTALFGGVYRYAGRVTPERFAATYDSSYDHGALEMTRPPPLRR